MISQAELILRVITLWFLVLSHFFTEVRANVHFIGHALISAMFFKCRIYNSLSSKSTKLLNIHIYDMRAKYFSHKVDLDDIFAGRAQEQNLAFLEVHFHIFLYCSN